METKNIINIPEGFEIDKEQSTERRIVLKKIEDKSKEVLHYDFGGTECIDDKNGYIVIY